MTSVTLYFPVSQNHNSFGLKEEFYRFHHTIITNGHPKWGEGGGNSLAVKCSYVRTDIYKQNKLIFQHSKLWVKDNG